MSSPVERNSSTLDLRTLTPARVALGRGKTPAKLHAARGEEGGVTVEAYLG